MNDTTIQENVTSHPQDKLLNRLGKNLFYFANQKPAAIPVDELLSLLANNRRWAESMKADDADFFARLSAQQRPEYLWIGCSDSRVPANEIVGLLCGELFVHRNVANVVVPDDLNCLAVVQFAVDILKVQEIIVCGHYGCGGVRAALDNACTGMLEEWLGHVKNIRDEHSDELAEIHDEEMKFRRLCELNVLGQVANLASTDIMQSAWLRGQKVRIHGVIYDLADGILKELGVRVSGES